MNISREIAPHLPYLRRFARALCGTQKSGDAYVVATLEALVADIDAFPPNMSAKVGLYHLFMRCWSSITLNVEERPEDELSPAERNVSLLTPRSRQAFLLRTVEGFSVEDVAAILAVTPHEVDTLIEQAGREIAERVATDVLIIEDEALIAQDIEFIARDLGHNVIGIARTHREAVEIASGHHPGLILADIQLADGSSGLNAVNELLQTFDCPVIFITAFPERLLTGERPEPAFLISKPYKVDTVKATISQALFFERKATRVA
ncbi:response regulator [Methylocystis echinoides]|jgi:DNA-directed RNA polymerase specialized sigma24 family protein|uniref:Response regulator n=1 Tax=Methylocystis echinoides TaxID=29468 RepID=A0A9W6GR09_9HYPH|nr:response regulator [Methylocystis echinoides]GLI91409.1 response regulator [Methylocystis echinoides]